MTFFQWLEDLFYPPTYEFESEEEGEEEMPFYDDDIDVGVSDDDMVYIRFSNDEDEIDRAISMSPNYARTLASRLIMMADTVGKIPFKGKPVIKNDVYEPQSLAAKASVDELDHLGMIIDSVISSQPNEWESLKSGKVGLFGFFVGRVMKENQYANPQLVVELLQKRMG
jgi:hypothetical protein